MNRLKIKFESIRKFFRTLHREAALDSLRNMLSVIGLACVIGDFATMRLWMMLPAAGLFFAVWRIDYWRHFRGESAEEYCARELGDWRIDSSGTPYKEEL